MASRRTAEPARRPRLPHPDRLATVGARILDPGGAPVADGTSGNPTAYVAHRVMVEKGPRLHERVEMLRTVAREHGWDVRLEAEQAKAVGLPFGVRRVQVFTDSAPRQPDAWHLLQFVRQTYGRDALRGIDLDHVVSTQSFEPQHWDIPHPNHWDIPHPDDASSASPGLMSYGVPGSGGRQPIGYAGPKPSRRADSGVRGRRPVVATLDTGCYPHYWFEGGVVRTDVELNGYPIGYTGDASNPELHGNLIGPLDGSIDRIAGHGTFIAGIVHQACPDATILTWRGIETERALVESEFLTTLAQIAELVRRYRHGEPGGHPIDVLSLSLGYYHENDADDLLDPILWSILAELGRLGVIVVCSAGNDATERPCFPAAFAPWRNGKGPQHRERRRVPVVSVGAENPNGSDALFTNTGPWVRAYALGAGLMSTMPPFDGGGQPLDRVWVKGRVRESIDPDDYRSGQAGEEATRGGFGLWSGTSFAAPLVAGRLAASMRAGLMDRAHPGEAPAAAVRRGWRAVSDVTEIQPPQ